jgi:arylsulfatase A-like enzyme
MRKILIGLLAVVVALGASAYVMRANILLSVVKYRTQKNSPVAAFHEISWEQGPATADVLIGQRPPNIVVILADDMGYNDVSTNGGGIAGGRLQTPNIDAIAADGVLFEQGHSGSSVCAISRAAMLTGRYATRFGFHFTPTPDGMAKIIGSLNLDKNRMRRNEANKKAPEDPLTYAEKGLPVSEITMAELLKDQGYRTLHIGKWHLGKSPEFRPGNQGFDESLFMESALFMSEDHPGVVNARVPFDPIDKFLWAIGQHSVSFNEGPAFEPDRYLTDYFTDEAVKVIEANRNRPFFLYLAHWGIHSPLQSAKADYEAMADIEDHRLRVYAGMARAVDRSVGKVMQALEDNGLTENTLVFFTSDNGGAHYIGLPEINTPFRGWKLTFFEGGTRVPFMAKWPGHIEPGSRFSNPVSHMDILPTALAAADGTMPTDRKIDGVNLLPYLSGEVVGEPHDVLFWSEGYYQAMQKDGWKMQVSTKPNKVWLHNLNEDPTEQFNVADDNPERVAEFRALLAAHTAEQLPPMWPSVAALAVTIDKTLADKEAKDDEYIYWPN